jgi:cation diffusion facilitator CzcD-associated flavoprotein CzcO
LVSGVGQLNRPAIPAIPGLERFRGIRFHSARWNHAADLRGRRVAVVGNAASALQFVPEIAPQVAHLTILQRSANWVVPRFDRAYSAAEHARFRRFPWLAKLYRWWIWLSYESSFPVFRKSRFMSRVLEKKARAYIDAEIADPALRAKLVPDYPVGAKRMLISDDYYRALNRSNVSVETAGIDHVEEDAVVLRDGRRIAIDVLILATGFESTAFLAPMEITGRGGRSLTAVWQHGARAYLGLTVAGFPNFFMMYGPNTNLGHNSIIFMIECQTHYIMECLRWLRARGLQWMDVRPEAMHAYNVALQRELASTVWAEAKHSWYKTADGTITNNWSGSTIRYWWRTRHPDFAAYDRRAQPAAAARSAITSAGARDDAAA